MTKVLIVGGTFDKYKYYITWFEEHGFKKEDYLVKR